MQIIQTAQNFYTTDQKKTPAKSPLFRMQFTGLCHIVQIFYSVLRSVYEKGRTRFFWKKVHRVILQAFGKTFTAGKNSQSTEKRSLSKWII